MKKRNLTFFTLSCLLLTVIGLGVSIIYSDYIYTPARGLVSINVTKQLSPSWEPSMNNPYSSRLASDFMKSVDNWAKESRAAIIYKNAFSSGCGYSDYSGWLISSLGIPAVENKTAGGKEVYTTEGNSFNAAYVNDGILFPGKANLRISGTFNDESLPPVLAGCDYLYPLTMASTTDGVYLTDASEIDSLLKLFDDKGYEILHVQRPLSIFALAKRMLSDGHVTRAVACAMVGLFFCFIYSTVMLYRENIKSLQIHRIFGLSKKQIVLGSIVIAVLVSTAAVGVFSIILFRGLSYMSKYDLNYLFCYITLGITALSAGTSLVCAISTNRAISRRKRS